MKVRGISSICLLSIMFCSYAATIKELGSDLDNLNNTLKGLDKNLSAMSGTKQVYPITITNLINWSEDQFLDALLKNYDEMKLLAGPVEATAEVLKPKDKAKCASVKRFGPEQHIEFDRTWAGLRILQQVMKYALSTNEAIKKAAYNALTANQFPAIKLPEKVTVDNPEYNLESFAKKTEQLINTDEILHFMIAYILLNDLGKITSKVEEIKNLLPEVRSHDHDILLYKGLEWQRKNPTNFKVSKTFAQLTPEYQELMLIILGADFNIAQFWQTEDLPANLIKFLQLGKGQEKAREYYYYHAFFDTAGAQGQAANCEDGSLLIKPLLMTMLQTMDLLEKNIKAGIQNPEKVYNELLQVRATALGLGDVTKNPVARAQARLAYLSRISNKAEFEGIIQKAWVGANEKTLLNILNATGINDAGFFFYYAPAMFAAVLPPVKEANKYDELAQKVGLVLSVLSQIYDDSLNLFAPGELDVLEPGVYVVNVGNIAYALKTVSDFKLSNIEVRFPAGYTKEDREARATYKGVKLPEIK